MDTKNIEDIYPLSPMQQGMLFHSILDPENDVYTGYITCKLYGDLEVSALQQAWQRVVAHHSILRSSFVWEDLEEPLQVVQKQVDVPFFVADWSKIPAEAQEQNLLSFLESEQKKGFNLLEAPLLRLHVFRLAENIYQFTWTHHHLLFDGWTFPIILKDVFTLYEAIQLGNDYTLAPVRPYRDYIAWLQEQDLSVAESFWRNLLGGFNKPNSLALDTMVTTVAEPKTAHNLVEISLSPEYMEKLQVLARQHQLTMNTMVQGAWALLLHRYSGDQDILFGATVSGRPAELKGVETMVGLFINSLPVRVQIADQDRLLPWLKTLQSQLVQMRQFEFTPLVQIQGWSSVPRDLPLFETLIVFENYPVSDAMKSQEGSLKIRDVRSLEQTNYPITLVAGAHAELTLKISFDRSRFSSDSIMRMLRHLKTLLEGMADQPEQLISNLPLLSPAEQRELLLEWNDTRQDFSIKQTGCIHELFEAQAERTPQAPALVFNQLGLSYQQLNQCSSQLAHYLKKMGVESNSLVGLYIDRCPEMIVALLGILKSGCAYLPLDPNYPQDRLALMIADAKVRLIVTLEKFLTEIPGNGSGFVCLDRDWEHIAQESDQNNAASARPDDLAYVIYTSGSTGTPKGVMIPHRALVNHARAMVDLYQITADDRLLQFISLSFDASGEEFYPALISGATLILHAAPQELQGAELLKFYQENRINILHLPVAFWHQWVDDLAGQGLKITPAPKVLLVGGESPAMERLTAWYQMTGPDTRFINAYGPTETTITAILFSTGGRDDKVIAYRSLPIGKPIANVQAYVLDAKLRPVPVGVAGELYIGGAGLAKGYLGRPDLTAEKFITHPFSDQPGALLYKTGDLVRYLPDGNLVFIGRSDNQIKIRGFRVELEEIERAIVESRLVKETVVILRQDEPGDFRLVGYLVSESPAIDLTAVRTHLKSRLPEYMVPAAFVILEKLPLLPNGKIDRKALPAPDLAQTGHDQVYVAPRTPTEEIVAGIWSQVLRRERIGVHDNFFDLGGHSLLATQLVSRLRDAFQVDLPLRAIFESPTVANFAEKIIVARQSESAVMAPPIQAISGSAVTDLPLSFAQQRLWFLDQLAPGGTFYNIPSVVRIAGALDLTILEKSINEIIRRHQSLRTTFNSVAGKPVQVVAPELWLAIEPVDLREIPLPERNERARQIVTEETRRPFNLETGPLFRVTVLRLDDQEHVVALTMHHIISDGWSIGILINELATLYSAFIQNVPASLPALPIQYPDFAYWQREWLQGPVLEAQIQYWKETLAGSPAVLELPLDRPRPPVQTFAGAQKTFQLSKQLSDDLLAITRHESVTLFMTMLAAYQVLLSRYSGQTDICVGSPIANRNRAEIEGLIGFFVNTLVLRSDLSGNPTFKELLARVREVTLGAYAHQDLPFEKIVEVTQPQRDLSHAPLFQTMLVLQNNPIPELELPGLKLRGYEADNVTAQFDLTLTLNEGENGLLGTMEYNTDLFDSATIDRILVHFQSLLNGIAADPEQKISTLKVLTPAEERQYLQLWNDTSVDTALIRNQCFHELFERQVAQAPDAIALAQGEKQMTYDQLNRRANQVAHYLKHMGVGPEVLVGISTERSFEMLSGVLGILKAGAAYMPLDPTYPKDRLAYMLEDSQTPILLTQQHLTGILPEHQARVVLLDADWDTIAAESDANFVSSAHSENTAYIIYTSGSTGKPKGVMLTHQGMCNLSEAQKYAFGIGIGTNVLQFSSFSFDASVWEMIMTLRVGATFHLVHPDSLVPGPDMIRMLQERRINTITLPPSILAALPEEQLPDLSTIIAAGEALPADLVNRWSPARRFFNAYGPTEVTVCASYKLCQGSYRASPSIGKPIANARVYILDAFLNPVPIGVPGELVVGGEGVGKGYLNRPDLTAEKFIPDPFAETAGARLYRTGDLARFLANGDIEFLGRIDHQVKVRGFRIELGEIEAVLGTHPAIRDVIVIAREDVPGNKRLVAYLTVDPENSPDSGALRIFLKEQLPEYMVPSAFVVLEAFPILPNGKVNRRALPAPDQASLRGEREYVAPRNETEEKIAAVCAQILNIEQVGVFDNFFELGGHSLLATQLISRLRDTFKIELPLRTLFEKPTVAELGMAVEVAQASGTEQPMPEIKRAARDERRVKRTEI